MEILQNLRIIGKSMTISVNFENLGKSGNLGTKSRDVPSKSQMFHPKVRFPIRKCDFLSKSQIIQPSPQCVCNIYNSNNMGSIFSICNTKTVQSRKIFNVLENLGNLGKSEKSRKYQKISKILENMLENVGKSWKSRKIQEISENLGNLRKSWKIQEISENLESRKIKEISENIGNLGKSCIDWGARCFGRMRLTAGKKEEGLKKGTG